MKCLIDTHVLLWLVDTPEVLSGRVLQILQDPSASILVSIVVPWEIAIKTKTGKLNAAALLQDFELKITKAGFELLGATVRDVIRGGGLPLHHRDPFDRLLIAQAFERRIPILSNDDVLDLYGVSRIWD
jgi:PIN domain nuclease of toxin-antitoxin system